MKKIQCLSTCLMLFLFAGYANATITMTTQHGFDPSAFDGQIAVGDLLSGLIPDELPGDEGWHSVNTAPQDQLPAFTDDARLDRGFYGLLNDFPNAVENYGDSSLEDPAKVVQYDLGGVFDIDGIQILTGNLNDADGRVFSTTVIEYSANGGADFAELGYFQSDPSGTENSGAWKSTLVDISDDQGGFLVTGVTDLIFNFYAVHHNDNVMQDPFAGVNPFTGVDDGIAVDDEGPITSPLVWEIDVLGQPSNSFNDADFNEDGAVDGDDFLIWQGGFNQFAGDATKGDGDADTDGFVDGDDFLIWQSNFGSGDGNASSAVPEPAACVLIVLAALATAVLRRP